MNIHILSLNKNLYSTRRLIEEARVQGHEIEVLNYVHLATRMETQRQLNIALPDVIIPRIAANMTVQGARVIQYYEKQAVRSTLSSKALLQVRNKYNCIVQLAAAQLPVPKTHLLDEDTDLDALFQEKFRFPIILKMAESTHGHGVLLLKSMEGLRRTLLSFKAHAPFLIQEFIREAAGSDVRAFVVNGKLVARMKRIATQGDFRSNLHRGGIAKTVTLTERDQAIILQAATNMDIAVAGIDLLQSAKGLLIIEINASPGLEGIEKNSGVNIAKAIIDYATKIDQQ